MDTSKEYIKMCEKAKEIQKEWKPKSLDIFSNSYVISYVTDDDFYKCIKDKGDYFKRQKIWLPHQDQLQEMIIEKQFNQTKDSLCIDLISQMTLFCFSYGEIRDLAKEYAKQFSSMEQLWLAFVMKEKYNKIWDGEEWVVKNE